MIRSVFTRFNLSITLAISILLFIPFTAAQPVLAGGIVTNCNDDTEFSTLVAGGGAITFNCGTKTIPLSSTKTISVGTAIYGSGKITLSGGHSHRLFVVASGVSFILQDITLTSGYGSDGDGGTIVNHGALTLNNAKIENATTSNYYGGAVYTTGPVDILYSQLLNNKAGNGGAIYAAGASAQVTMSNSTLRDNSVASNLDNHAQGGAIMLYDGAKLEVDASTIVSNSAKYGGAIYNDLGSAVLQNTDLSYNNATEGAGGIFNTGTLTVQGSTLTYNGVDPSGNGGGIHNEGTLYVQNSILDRNRTDYGNGGGINNKGTANLFNVTLSDNTSNYGGGIANDHGTLIVTGGMITGNHANVAGGGGIGSSYGPMTLTGVTVSGNFASGDAGGVENGKGAATLTNVTISGNYANSGGGMWNLYGGTATLTNVTFANNYAFDPDNGGGIGNTDDANTHLYLTNVLFGKSKQGDNCAFQGQFRKPPDSVQFSASSDGSCSFGGGKDNLGLKLGKLESNGGSVLTHRLKPGSPAINGGTCTNAPTEDAREVARPKGGTCDMGAVEYVPCGGAPPAAPVLSPANKAKLHTSKVLLDWTGPDCATKFRIVVRRGSIIGPVVFEKAKVKKTEVRTSTLELGRKYFWQVSACIQANCMPGPWRKFKLKP